MRKAKTLLIALLLLTVFIPLISALNDRTFCEAADIGLIPLDRVYYLPKYSRKWIQNEKYNANNPDSVNGTYITGTNIIGKVGCVDCSHNIQVTVSTGNGRFVGVSDPTKYRDFYVGLFPRTRYFVAEENKEDDWACFCTYTYTGGVQTSTPVDHDSRIPNTKGSNVVSVVSPKIIDSNNKYISNLIDSGLYSKITKWWCDMVLCLEPLTYEDEMHLIRSENDVNEDEYIATVTIEWHCLEQNCNKNHSGTYTFILIGYYGDRAPSGDMAISMFVVPDTAASSLKITDILSTSSREQRIAGLQLYSYARSGGWTNLVTCFVSSSQNPSISGPEFSLKRTTNTNNANDPNNRTIPYTVKISNTADTGVATFDGTDTTSSDNKIDYSNSINPATGKNNNTTYMIEYKGDVSVVFSADTASTVLNNQAMYSGIYKDTIYYHVVYTY